MVKIFKARFWDEVTFFNHLRIHAFWCWNCKSFTCWIFIQGKFQNDYYVITKRCYVITRLLRNFKILYWNKKKHWTDQALTLSILPLVLFIFCFFLPKSLQFLYSRGDYEEGKLYLKRFMKYTNTDDSILEKLSLKLERISSQAYHELVLGSKLQLLIIWTWKSQAKVVKMKIKMLLEMPGARFSVQTIFE